MRKAIFLMVLPAVMLAAGFGYRYFLARDIHEKIYVALEGDGKVVVINPATEKIVSSIDLTIEHNGGLMPYFPHSLQVSPDMKTVWVTANAGTHQNRISSVIPRVYAHGMEMDGDTDSDDVIIIDPESDTIIKRVQIGIGTSLTRIELAPDGFSALVTAEARDAIYKINTKTFIAEEKIPILAINDDKPQESQNSVKSPDGTRIYTADFAGGYVAVIDTAAGKELTQIKVGKNPSSVGFWVRR